MSKQTKLDSFLWLKKQSQPQKKIKTETERDHHQSSRENSERTVKLHDEEQDVELEVFRSKKLFCPPFVLLTPVCMIYYKTIQGSLRQFSAHYSKNDVKDFMLKNLRHHGIPNLENLNRIDDEDLWSQTIPDMIDIVLKNLRILRANVKILTVGTQEVIDLNRMEIFLILASMFLGIFPKQVHEDCVHFGQLMAIRQNEFSQSRSASRREKLKCFISYFKAVTNQPELLDGDVRFQRTRGNHVDIFEQKVNLCIPLREVEILSMERTSIEDYCGKGIMVDFANSKLGGGVLKNGCVQQEILFSIFPEAVVSKLICQALEDNQAVIIYGARRFSIYSGYSDSFQFIGPAEIVSEAEAQRSVIVAIDATDFSAIPSSNYQYNKRGVAREICKASIGFEGAGLQADEAMPIVTGRWGCGAFKGDQQLKFLIQWIASSEAGRRMIYITDRRETAKIFEMVQQAFREETTSYLLGILQEYGKVRSIQRPVGLLEYIKNYAI